MIVGPAESVQGVLWRDAARDAPSVHEAAQKSQGRHALFEQIISRI